MNPSTTLRILLPVLLGAGCLAGSAVGQTLPQADVLEIGVSTYRFDADIEPWRGISIGTRISSGPRHSWNVRAAMEHRFDEPSFVYSLAHRYSRGRLLARLAGQTSNGGLYNARWRMDAQLGARVLPKQNLVLLAGAFQRLVRDGHRDTGLITEFQAYLSPSIVVQAGVRWMHSNPGGAWSRYHDAALTLGRSGKRYIILHAAAGREAYEIIDPLTIYTDFDSRSVRLTWQEWTGRRSGFSISASWYSNPYYSRGGIEAGFFVNLGS